MISSKTLDIVNVNYLQLLQSDVIDQMITNKLGALKLGIQVLVYQSLQAITDPEEGVIYFIPKTDDGNNGYDEYLYVNNSFEHIGANDIDLTKYVNVDDPQTIAGQKTFTQEILGTISTAKKVENKLTLNGEDYDGSATKSFDFVKTSDCGSNPGNVVRFTQDGKIVFPSGLELW